MSDNFTKDDMKPEYGIRLRNGQWYNWRDFRDSDFDAELMAVNRNYSHDDIMIVVDTSDSIVFMREQPKCLSSLFKGKPIKSMSRNELLKVLDWYIQKDQQFKKKKKK